MRATTTILLVILTGGLAWFALHLDNASHTVAKGSARLFDFKRQDADTIEISGKDQNVSLKRRGEQWWITSPIDDRANPLPVGIILDNLEFFESIDSIKPDELGKDGWKRAGLNGTSLKLSVRHGNKVIASCRVGGHAPIENTIYIAISKKDAEEKIYAVALPVPNASQNPDVALPDFLAVLQIPGAAWRDPALLRLKAEAVRRLVFSAGTGIMEFKRAANEPWELLKPLQTRASDERVNAVLATLLHMEARPLEKGSDATATGSTALPGMKVSIEAEGQEKPVELALTAAADPSADIQVTASDRPGTFLLPAKAGNIWKLQPNDLRDTRLARIQAEDLNSIRIKSLTNPEVILTKKGETWMLTRFCKAEPANQDRVLRFINEMNSSLVREFASDAANNVEPFGLHQPFLELEWRGKDKDKSSLLKFG
ncbi:MAG: DUF4340 domain-containing protein, partial [Verrucomicrobiaceae bacterium]